MTRLEVMIGRLQFLLPEADSKAVVNELRALWAIKDAAENMSEDKPSGRWFDAYCKLRDALNAYNKGQEES